MIIQTGRHAKFYKDSFAELMILLLLYLLLLIFALLSLAPSLAESLRKLLCDEPESASGLLCQDEPCHRGHRQ